MARKMATKKTSNKYKKSKKKQKASAIPYTVSSTQAAKVSNKMVKIPGKAPKSSGVSIKTQCDLCKLSYSTEKELSEHLLSIMHHTKLEDKEENTVHVCTLCFVTSQSMADYRIHVITDKHQKKLSSLRGDDGNMSQLSNKRPDTQTLHNQSTSKSGSAGFKKQFQGSATLHTNKTPALGGLFGGNKTDKSTYFKFGAASSKFSQNANRDFWNGQYRNKNNVHQWPRHQMNDNYSVHNERRHINGGAGHYESPPTNQYYEPWGSGFYGDYFGHHGTTNYSLPYWKEGEQDKWRNNRNYQNEQHNSHNFTKNVGNTIPEAWDEQLLLQQEQFLAGMDDVHFSSRRNLYHWPNPANGEQNRQKGNAYERKRVRDEDVVQESHGKHPRANNFSSDHAPAEDVPKMNQSTHNNPEAENKSRPVLSSNVNARTQSNIDSNILERSHINSEILEAESMLVSLRNKMYTAFDKKGDSLKYKQVHQTGERPDSNEESSPDVSSTSNLPSKHCDSSAHSASSNLFTVAARSQKNAISNTLDDIRKSIEKNVLDNEEPQAKIKSSAPPTSKRIRCSSGSTFPGTTSDSAHVFASRLLPKPGHKAQMDKDSLKKMINAPYSRDERLQLAKMLQSRVGHKTATANAPLRTGLQLEGLHDSVVVSQEVNLDAAQNCDVQTIKLEDLSDSVRHQILDLIGHDVSNLSPQDKLIKEKSKSRTNVIVLSDDDDLEKISKHKKKTSKTISNISTTEEIVVVTKTKKKRKLVSKTNSIDTVSVVQSTCSQEDSEPPHITHEPQILLVSELKKPGQDNSKKHISKKKEKTILCTDNDMEIVSCSSDVVELGRKLEKRKKPFREFTKKTSVNNVSSSLSSSSNKQAKLGNGAQSSELLHEQVQSLLNGSMDREESPAIRIELTAFANKDGTNSSPVLHSSSQSSKQILNEMPDHSPDILLVSSNVQTDLQPSSLHAHTVERSDMKVRPSPLRTLLMSSSSHTAKLSTTVAETTPDSSLSLIEPQKSPVKTTETLSSPQSPSPSTQSSIRLTLPPSTWLKDRAPPPDSRENHSRSASVEPSLLSPQITEPKIEDTTGVATVVIDDEDNCTADDSEQLSSNQISCAASAVISESSSRVMSELLVLSEREEDVKQEKMSLDLRLSRLHKLLEQAVVQINKCTERRQQLHDEEQELAHQRMSLLRAILSTQDASSSDPSLKSSEQMNKNNPTSASVSNPDEHIASPTSSAPFAESSKVATSSSEHPQGTSLSRDDWLAKFSSFLPCDPSRGNQVTLARALPVIPQSESRELNHHTIIPVSSLSLPLPSDKLANEVGTLPHLMTQHVGVETQDCSGKSIMKTAHIRDQPSQALPSEAAIGSCRDIVMLRPRVSSDDGSFENLAAPAASKPISGNIMAAPVMYLGSFKRADAHISIGTHVVNLTERHSCE